jgi:alpha-glucosidase (family GH31 glycosyl hydrolase)
MEKTKEWWKDALNRFILTDQVIRFDGVFLDYLTPLDENPQKSCPYNKWNNPALLPDSIPRPIFNATICMDSRYDISKHYNIHGLYSHSMIEATAKAFDSIIPNRTLIISRHAFLGSGQYGAKWIGEFDPQWDDFRRSIISTVEMSMFGFSLAGGDVCGSKGVFEYELCENWIKAAAMSPLMKLTVDDGDEDDERYNAFTKNGLFEVLNASLHLRYSLMPYMYTQFWKATKYGTVPIRPIAFEFPADRRTYEINNQWMWGDMLMVTVSNAQSGTRAAYLPRGEWYEYYRGFLRDSRGESVDIQVGRNETSLFVKGGSVLFKQDCMATAVDSKNTFVDVIIALNQTNNFTASGVLYMDDSSKKNTERKDNYHRLINFTVYRQENYGVIEVRRLSGRFATKLSYRDLVIMGLKSKPVKITVNENTQGIDGSKCVWDDFNRVCSFFLLLILEKKIFFLKNIVPSQT